MSQLGWWRWQGGAWMGAGAELLPYPPPGSGPVAVPTQGPDNVWRDKVYASYEDAVEAQMADLRAGSETYNPDTIFDTAYRDDTSFFDDVGDVFDEIAKGVGLFERFTGKPVGGGSGTPLIYVQQPVTPVTTAQTGKAGLWLLAGGAVLGLALLYFAVTR